MRKYVIKKIENNKTRKREINRKKIECENLKKGKIEHEIY